MPKMKTCKALKGRFKLTKKKKVIKTKPGHRHLLEKKSSQRKRSLKKRNSLEGGVRRTYLKMGLSR